MLITDTHYVVVSPRKSQLVSMAEQMIRPVDDHCRRRVEAIFKEKEKHQAYLKLKAEQAKKRPVGAGVPCTPSLGCTMLCMAAC